MTRKIINNQIYYEIELSSDDVINYDLKLSIVSKKLKFYSWFNLWFNTFEIISNFVLNNNCFDENKKSETNINTALSAEIDKKVILDPKILNKRGRLVSIIHTQYMKGINRKKLSKALNRVIAKYKKSKRKKNAIKTLKNNRDMNNILDGINQLAKDKGVEPLDRTNLSFTIERKFLDKLKTKIRDDFKVKYTYELLPNLNV